VNRNLALSLAAGNATIWKPSPSTPLCSIAVTRIISEVLEKNGISGAVASLVTGDKDVGETLVASPQAELGKKINLSRPTELITVSSFVYGQ
jgi:aldehyde dehydrogenase family 7 member A1